MDLTLVDLWVKINGTHYRNVLLSQKILPVTCDITEEFVIIQQDKARRACETISLLEWKTINSH